MRGPLTCLRRRRSLAALRRNREHLQNLRTLRHSLDGTVRDLGTVRYCRHVAAEFWLFNGLKPVLSRHAHTENMRWAAINAGLERAIRDGRQDYDFFPMPGQRVLNGTAKGVAA